MNGATEATLAELLREAQATNVNLQRLQSLMSSSGGGSGSSGGSPLASIVRNGPIVGAALGAVAAASNLVSGIFNTIGGILGKVVNGFTNTISNLYAFGVSAANGTAKLSDFYAAFKDLPFYLGTVAGIFADLVRYSEGLLETYRNLTRVGASFSGDLGAMRIAAAKSQLSMAEFANVVSRNSETFATMGGNVQNGINQFVAIQNRLMGPNSPYARQLLALGYTSADAAEAIAIYMRGQGSMNKQELMNVDKVTKGVVAYVTELDTLTKLTGQDRKTLQDKLQAATMEENWKSFTSRITDTSKVAAYELAIQMMVASSKENAEMLKQEFQGLSGPITQAQTEFTAGVNTANIAINRQIKDAIDAGMRGPELAELVRKSMAQMGDEANSLKSAIGPASAALQTYNNGIITSTAGVSQFSRNFREEAERQSKMTAAQRAAEKQRLEQEKGNAAALATAEQNIKNFGNSLVVMIWEKLGPLSNTLIKFGESITSTIASFIGSNGFQNAVKTVTDWFVDTYTMLKVSWYEGWESFWNTLFARIEEVFSGFGEAFDPLWEKHIKPGFISGWNSLLKALEPYFIQLIEYIKTQVPIMVRSAYENVTGQSADEALSGKAGAAAGAATLGTAGAMMGLIGGPVFAATTAAIGAAIGGIAGALGLIDYGIIPDAPKRHSGTLAMTGRGAERGNELIEVQPSETVLTKEQTDQFGRALAQGVELNNNLSSEIKTLNKQIADMVKASKETAEYTKRNLDAIRDLNGNLFAT